MPDESGEYLSTEDVARMLGVSVRTVRRAFRSGSLAGRKVGYGWLTTRRAVDEWLEKRTDEDRQP